jgi:hypothetical protein
MARKKTVKGDATPSVTWVGVFENDKLYSVHENISNATYSLIELVKEDEFRGYLTKFETRYVTIRVK